METVRGILAAESAYSKWQQNNVHQVDHLREVGGFVRDGSLVVLDADGVFLWCGKEGGLDRLLALRRLGEKASLIVVKTARLDVADKGGTENRKISNFPFISDRDKDRLKNLLCGDRKNPHPVIFHTGLGKLFGENGGLERVIRDALEVEKQVLIVGSGVFDRVMVNGMVKRLGDSAMGIHFACVGDGHSLK